MKKSNFFTIIIIVLFFTTVNAKDNYVGTLLMDNSHTYFKVSYDSLWWAEFPYLDGEKKYLIRNNPTDDSWSFTRYHSTFQFQTHISENDQIEGEVRIHNSTQPFSLYKQIKVPESAIENYIGHFADTNGNITQVYERFNYLHIHSPYSRDVMSLKPIGGNRFFSVSGEIFEFIKPVNGPLFSQIKCTGINYKTTLTIRKKEYRQESVWILVEEDSIFGQLYIPEKEHTNSSGIIIFSGGKYDHTHKKMEAEFFSSHGYSVLLFDKAGVGRSKCKRTYLDMSFIEKADYYEHIVKWFRHNSSVKPDYIGLHGGSEEGRLALMLASDSTVGIDFVMAVSAPVQSYYDTRLFAINRFFRNRNFSESNMLPMSSLWSEYLQESASGNISNELKKKIDSLSKVNPDLYLPKSHIPRNPKPNDIFLDMQEYLNNVKCPVYFQYGGLDELVNVIGCTVVINNVKSWHPLSALRTYPNLNHSLMTVEQKIGTGILDDKIEWLRALNNESTENDFNILDSHLNKYIEWGKLPGLSALVVHNGNVVYKSHKGYLDVDDKTNVDDRALYRVASLTKTITSLAVLQLVDKGKIKLDDPVSKYIPAFENLTVYSSGNPPKTPMTIRHLLSHSSGLSSSFYSDEVGNMYAQKLKGYHNLEDLVTILSTIPLAAEPGTEFYYSYSPDVLAYIVQNVTGVDWSEHLEKALFKPLDMKNTSFHLPKENMPRLATLYQWKNNAFLPIQNPEEYKSIPRGNTGLISTIHDYSNLCTMLLNEGSFKENQLISKELFSQFITNQIPQQNLPIKIGNSYFHGMGFGLGAGITHHSNPLGQTKGSFGWIGATHTYYFVDLENQLFGILFSNFNDRERSTLIFEFNKKVYESLRKNHRN